ncbi:MAG: DUF58 domain-containing protein [Phycisphaerales bacterium]|nr:DUF58 domain-containing protein [Phycisphaerales bacterium]NNM26986.1 DUF58 domain-containing protein [Phycisphaerales bacterium]
MSKLDQVDVMSRKIFAGKLQGERRSKKRGISVEFADYRHYAHGDDLRFIDWNIYARLDKLFLKMFLEEEDLSLIIAIDTSASMHWGNPSKFVFNQRLAMALGYIGLSNHNRVSLYAFGDELRPLPSLRGKRRLREMGAWLLELTPGGPGNFNDAMRSIALGRQGKGVMVILSDFMFKDGYEKGLRYLAGGGYDTYCMQVLSPEEIDPGRNGLAGDLRLTDVEDEDVAEVTVSAALLKRYKQNLDGYCGKLREFCVRRGMMHVTIDTKTDLDTLLLDYLRKRGLLR